MKKRPIFGQSAAHFQILTLTAGSPSTRQPLGAVCRDRAGLALVRQAHVAPAACLGAWSEAKPRVQKLLRNLDDGAHARMLDDIDTEARRSRLLTETKAAFCIVEAVAADVAMEEIN